MTTPQSSPPTREEPTSISEVVDLVTAYAKQETLGPLKGAGRWLARGAAGAACLGLGPVAARRSAILRLVQTEWDRSAEGSLSWLPVPRSRSCSASSASPWPISRINKDSLNKEPQ